MYGNHNPEIQKILTHIFLFALLIFLSCHRDSSAIANIDKAESIIMEYPDSALTILEAVDSASLRGDAERARYALLRTMALDKTGHDLTTFAILRPALEYYPDHGTPDEKLRTHYYRGRIYQNQGNKTRAMQSFLHAEDLRQQITDSLTLAMLLVAEANLQYAQYNLEYVKHNSLQAADIYGSLGRTDRKAKCLASALAMSVMMEQKTSADSILKMINSMEIPTDTLRTIVLPEILVYHETFGDDRQVMEYLNHISSCDSLTASNRIDLIHGYLQLGKIREAEQIFSNMPPAACADDSLMYLGAEASIAEEKEDADSAIESYKELAVLLADNLGSDLQKNLEIARDMHDFELARLRDELRHQRRNIMLTSIAVILIISIIILWLLYRNIRIRRRFEQENLVLRINGLEKEREALTELIKSERIVDDSIKEVVAKRLELVNTLLAQNISGSATRKRRMDRLINQMTADKETFLDTTRLAFKAIHPEFIRNLEQCSLTDKEIGYLCLLAMNLNVSEISNYLDLKGHYHYNSDLRQKLSIDSTISIGTYIRTLLKSTDRTTSQA